MRELLGFFVLSGPLIPYLAWLAISFLLVKFCIKPTGVVLRRQGIKLVVFSLIALLPFVDELIGRIYFSHLCNDDAGFEVYQTVELPMSYWEKNGKRKIFSDNGGLDRDFWLENIDQSKVQTERYSKIFSIDRMVTKIIYRKENALLGQITTFEFSGGWFRNSFGYSNTRKLCRFTSEPDFSHKFYGSLFKATTHN